MRRGTIAVAALAQFGMATLPLCDLDLLPSPQSSLEGITPAKAWTTPESGHHLAAHDPATCPLCLARTIGSRPEARAELPPIAVAAIHGTQRAEISFVPTQFILSQAPRAPPTAS
jgi:hypothetical protein